MTDQISIEWSACDEDDCIGARLAATPKCLAHARDEQRDATLKQLSETGQIDARGVPITQALLKQICAAAPHDAEYRPTFTAVDFERATFKGEAEFQRATFKGDAWFEGSTFQSDAVFDRATFQAGAWFEGSTFQAGAYFSGATFKGVAVFDGVTVNGNAWFLDARFEQARQLGPLLVYGALRLDAAHFAQLTQIEASARGLSCQRTRFPAGVQFRLHGAQIVLDDADLPSPSILVGIAALSNARLARREQQLVEQGLVQAVWCLAPQAAPEFSARPRLLSVQGANVAGLAVSNVDLAECRFAGAHNLDHLRLETKVTFSAAPVRLPWD
jgi:uncharacterized protein YjbI with pentapeptide repeats